jgi:hypothetical protein
LNEVITNCERDPICSNQYPDLSEILNNTIEDLDQNPKKIRIHIPDSLISFPDEVDGRSFYYYLLSSSYLDNTYAAIPFIINQAEKNNFDSVIAFYENYMTEFLSTSGGYYSVICAEHPPMENITTTEEILSPSMMGWEIENQSNNREECRNWNVMQSPHTLDVMSESEIPTLLLSGHFDPVTPPEYGEIALRSFPFGQHIVDPVGSHGIAFNDDCTQGIVDDFLFAPFDPLDSTCLGDQDRRSPHVQKTALSIPFFSRANNIADTMIAIPFFFFPIMFLRTIQRGIRKFWKKRRGTLKKRTPGEWKLHRKFELANRVFYLSCIGFGFGLSHFRDQLSELPGYWNASALPGDGRWVLLIPFLIVLILPAVVIPSFRLWKFNRSIIRRTYYLFQATVCVLLAAYLIYSDTIFAWLR